MVDRIRELSIQTSGIDSEGDPFVILENGMIFFGNRNRARTDKLFYNLLPRKTRRNLNFEALQVALDIMIRYVDGGLMYMGPNKQATYKVKENDFVAEMGAFHGFYSLKLAQQVGEGGEVVAIEPMPDNFRLLQKNVLKNNLENVVCIKKGVWDTNTILSFNRKKGVDQTSSIDLEFADSESFDVPVYTLDTIFQDLNSTAKDFMIIQLNGAEMNALRGLTSFNPKNLTLATRYSPEGRNVTSEVRNELERRGYTVTIKNKDFIFATLDQ